MPLFGEKSDKAAQLLAAQPMIDWATNAPPAELAVELMGAFAQGAELTPQGLASWLVRSSHLGTLQLHVPIREAMQLLEHAELVYVSRMSEYVDPQNIQWKATRLGLATVAAGKSAVRQRIKDRTGL
jgi:hypothetical protein